MDQNETGIMERFYGSSMELTGEAILKLDKVVPGGSLHNVITRFERHCFLLLMVEENPPDVSYQVYYANCDKELAGFVMQLNLRDPKRDNLLFLFAQYLAANFINIDPVNVFNTYQQQTRSMVEKLDYVSVSVTTDLKGYNQPVMFAPYGSKGIVELTYIDKELFYKQFLAFDGRKIPELKLGTFVYMMLNKRNDYIKIGKSDNPKYREKTLSSDESEIILIGCWNVPARVEKDLHALFNSKRIRGEWFNLNFIDLKKAKEILGNY